MSIFDAMVEDPEFYVTVQKSKIVVAVVGLFFVWLTGGFQ